MRSTFRIIFIHGKFYVAIRDEHTAVYEDGNDRVQEYKVAV